MSPELKTRLSNIETTLTRKLLNIKTCVSADFEECTISDLQINFVALRHYTREIERILMQLRSTITEDWS